MDYFVFIVGLISSILGIVGFFLPSSGNRGKLIHAIYIIFVCLVLAVTFHVNNELNASNERLKRIASIERSAKKLLDEAEFGYTHGGFVQAALTFLEKTSDVLPQTYERAKLLCEKRGCLEKSKDQSGSALAYDLEMITTAYEMKGIIRSVSTITSEE
jgi:hypothetical protein